jgi:hypothetical protein
VQPAGGDLGVLRDCYGGGGEVARSGGAQTQVDLVLFAHNLISFRLDGKIQRGFCAGKKEAASRVKTPKQQLKLPVSPEPGYNPT